MDATEAREERQKAKAARDEAHAKYNAVPPADPAHKEFKEDWLRAEVVFARACLAVLVAEGTTSGPVFDLAKEDLARADRELDKLTSAAAAAAAAPAGLTISSCVLTLL